ncbi:carboxypeptidase-like regulatory domain-containing protein, partial [Dysgonomonas mossii]
MKNNVFIMRVLFLILLLLIVPLLHSQQIKNFCLEGVLFDTSKRAVDYATVTILSEVDSLYVKGNISNEKGQFRIENIPSGRYILSVTHLLYKRKYVNIEVQE